VYVACQLHNKEYMMTMMMMMMVHQLLFPTQYNPVTNVTHTCRSIRQSIFVALLSIFELLELVAATASGDQTNSDWRRHGWNNKL